MITKFFRLLLCCGMLFNSFASLVVHAQANDKDIYQQSNTSTSSVVINADKTDTTKSGVVEDIALQEIVSGDGKNSLVSDPKENQIETVNIDAKLDDPKGSNNEGKDELPIVKNNTDPSDYGCIDPVQDSAFVLEGVGVEIKEGDENAFRYADVSCLFTGKPVTREGVVYYELVVIGPGGEEEIYGQDEFPLEPYYLKSEFLDIPLEQAGSHEFICKPWVTNYRDAAMCSLEVDVEEEEEEVGEFDTPNGALCTGGLPDIDDSSIVYQVNEVTLGDQTLGTDYYGDEVLYQEVICDANDAVDDRFQLIVVQPSGNTLEFGVINESQNTFQVPLYEQGEYNFMCKAWVNSGEDKSLCSLVTDITGQCVDSTQNSDPDNVFALYANGLVDGVITLSEDFDTYDGTSLDYLTNLDVSYNHQRIRNIRVNIYEGTDNTGILVQTINNNDNEMGPFPGGYGVVNFYQYLTFGTPYYIELVGDAFNGGCEVQPVGILVGANPVCTDVVVNTTTVTNGEDTTVRVTCEGVASGDGRFVSFMPSPSVSLLDLYEPIAGTTNVFEFNPSELSDGELPTGDYDIFCFSDASFTDTCNNPFVVGEGEEVCEDLTSGSITIDRASNSTVPVGMTILEGDIIDDITNIWVILDNNQRIDGIIDGDRWTIENVPVVAGNNGYIIMFENDCSDSKIWYYLNGENIQTPQVCEGIEVTPDEITLGENGSFTVTCNGSEGVTGPWSVQVLDANGDLILTTYDPSQGTNQFTIPEINFTSGDYTFVCQLGNGTTYAGNNLTTISSVANLSVLLNETEIKELQDQSIRYPVRNKCAYTVTVNPEVITEQCVDEIGNFEITAPEDGVVVSTETQLITVAIDGAATQKLVWELREGDENGDTERSGVVQVSSTDTEVTFEVPLLVGVINYIRVKAMPRDELCRILTNDIYIVHEETANSCPGPVGNVDVVLGDGDTSYDLNTDVTVTTSNTFRKRITVKVTNNNVLVDQRTIETMEETTVFEDMDLDVRENVISVVAVSIDDNGDVDEDCLIEDTVTSINGIETEQCVDEIGNFEITAPEDGVVVSTETQLITVAIDGAATQKLVWELREGDENGDTERSGVVQVSSTDTEVTFEVPLLVGVTNYIRVKAMPRDGLCRILTNDIYIVHEEIVLTCEDHDISTIELSAIINNQEVDPGSIVSSNQVILKGLISPQDGSYTYSLTLNNNEVLSNNGSQEISQAITLMEGLNTITLYVQSFDGSQQCDQESKTITFVYQPTTTGGDECTYPVGNVRIISPILGEVLVSDTNDVTVKTSNEGFKLIKVTIKDENGNIIDESSKRTFADQFTFSDLQFVNGENIIEVYVFALESLFGSPDDDCEIKDAIRTVIVELETVCPADFTTGLDVAQQGQGVVNTDGTEVINGTVNQEFIKEVEIKVTSDANGQTEPFGGVYTATVDPVTGQWSVEVTLIDGIVNYIWIKPIAKDGFEICDPNGTDISITQKNICLDSENFGQPTYNLTNNQQNLPIGSNYFEVQYPNTSNVAGVTVSVDGVDYVLSAVTGGFGGIIKLLNVQNTLLITTTGTDYVCSTTDQITLYTQEVEVCEAPVEFIEIGDIVIGESTVIVPVTIENFNNPANNGSKALVATLTDANGESKELRRIITSSSTTFTFGNLTPGAYAIQVTAQGIQNNGTTSDSCEIKDDDMIFVIETPNIVCESTLISTGTIIDPTSDGFEITCVGENVAKFMVDFIKPDGTTGTLANLDDSDYIFDFRDVSVEGTYTFECRAWSDTAATDPVLCGEVTGEVDYPELVCEDHTIDTVSLIAQINNQAIVPGRVVRTNQLTINGFINPQNSTFTYSLLLNNSEIANGNGLQNITQDVILVEGLNTITLSVESFDGSQQCDQETNTVTFIYQPIITSPEICESPVGNVSIISPSNQEVLVTESNDVVVTTTEEGPKLIVITIKDENGNVLDKTSKRTNDKEFTFSNLWFAEGENRIEVTAFSLDSLFGDVDEDCLIKSAIRTVTVELPTPNTVCESTLISTGTIIDPTSDGFEITCVGENVAKFMVNYERPDGTTGSLVNVDDSDYTFNYTGTQVEGTYTFECLAWSDTAATDPVMCGEATGEVDYPELVCEDKISNLTITSPVLNNGQKIVFDNTVVVAGTVEGNAETVMIAVGDTMYTTQVTRNSAGLGVWTQEVIIPATTNFIQVTVTAKSSDLTCGSDVETFTIKYIPTTGGQCPADHQVTASDLALEAQVISGTATAIITGAYLIDGPVGSVFYNGQEVSNVTYNNNTATFSIIVPVVDGTNAFTFTINPKSNDTDCDPVNTTITVVYPPVVVNQCLESEEVSLTFVGLPTNNLFDTAAYQFTGVVNGTGNLSSLTLNGSPVTVANDGTFTVSGVFATEGNQVLDFVIVANDELCNDTQSLTITYDDGFTGGNQCEDIRAVDVIESSTSVSNSIDSYEFNGSFLTKDLSEFVITQNGNVISSSDITLSTVSGSSRTNFRTEVTIAEGSNTFVFAATSTDSDEICNDSETVTITRTTTNFGGSSSSIGGGRSSSILCGNGRLDNRSSSSREQCDDGNTRSGDGCSSTCQIEEEPVCGNGVIEIGEMCDDSNTVSGDGCNATCDIEDEEIKKEIIKEQIKETIRKRRPVALGYTPPKILPKTGMNGVFAKYRKLLVD